MGKGQTLHGFDALGELFGIKKTEENLKSSQKPGNRRDGVNQSGGAKSKRPPALAKDNAAAPYNFVPLPSAMLEAPLMGAEGADVREKYVSYVNEKGKLSGFIELDVEAKTPLYIGGGPNGTFFAPVDGRPMIPGSTMRGMCKNLMKILTCGAMRPSSRKKIESEEIEGDGDFYDRKLYFRTMADRFPEIRKAYTQEMVTKPPKGSSEKPKTKASAGFLIRYHDETGTHYCICPTTAKPVKPPKGSHRIQDYEVPNTRDEKAKSGNAGKCVQWQWNEDGERGVACFTGEMNTGKARGKAHYTVHAIPKPKEWNNTIPVPDEVVIAYSEDSTRDGVNLLDPQMSKLGECAGISDVDFGDVDFVVPCFYVEERGKVKHFGFGRYYRIPYNSAISEHIPKVLRSQTPDFSDAIFGRKEDWGSRVFFEDCACVGEPPAAIGEDYSHVLSSPNPTSFQLYLKQPDDGSLSHWNSKDKDGNPVPIRGYKFYWHWKNDPSAWRKDKNEPVLEGSKKIAPLPAGTKFFGRIRFERLSEEELGAILKIFSFATKDENTDICFKIGAGKSIGMGSVKIQATLKMIERDAYTRLFQDGTWNKGEMEEPDFTKYTQKFDDFLKNKLTDKKDLDAYNAVCDALRVMMNWRNTEIQGWNTNVQGMKSEVAQRDKAKEDIDARFKNRSILPNPEAVVSRAKGKP